MSAETCATPRIQAAAQQAVAVDGAGRLEWYCYLPLMRPGWPGYLASDRATTELFRYAAGAPL